MEVNNVTEAIVQGFNIWIDAQGIKTKGRGRSVDNISLEGIARLKDLILELAVRGKLVPQDPNDEPTSKLLKRIEKEKIKLIDEGIIKDEQPLPEIIEEEKRFELSTNWEWVRLGAISQINPRNEIDKERVVAFVPMSLITTSHTGEHGQEERTWKEINKGFTHFADGDIGLAKITPCFENSKAVVFSNLKNGFGAGTTELHIARPYGKTIDARYILINLKSPSYLKIGESKMTGTAGQKRVPKNFFSGHPIPLPPLQEQRRIVAKVEELMTLCEKLEKEQANNLKTHQLLVRTLLDRLIQAKNFNDLQTAWRRLATHFDTLFYTEDSIDQLMQTILQLAVLGKLVKQDLSDEPASELIKRIAAEKEILVKDGKLKKEAPLPEIKEEEMLFELPKNWEWVRLGTICQINPRNEIDNDLVVSFVPMSLITTSHAGEHGHEERTWNEINKGFTHFADGDIGLAKITPCFENSKAVIFSNLKNGFGAGTTELHIARPYGKTINARYILINLKSPGYLKIGESKMTGTAGQKRVPKSFFSEHPIPLPPLAEQQRIVSKVDELFELCNTLKNIIQSAEKIKASLSKAIVENAVA